MLKIVGLAVAGLILSTGAASAAEQATAARKPAVAAARKPSLPDWRGTWVNITGLYFSNPGTFRPLQNAGVGTNLPPLTAEYQKRWDATLAAAARGEPTKDRRADCVWPGVPSINLSPMPNEYVISSDRVAILNESTGGFRLVYTDGRKVPEELDPSYNGFSTGRWEGDTLVIDTVGLRGDTLLEQSGLEHSDQLTVRERIRKVAPDIIENEVTMTDPLALTKPWTSKVQYRRMPPGDANRIIEFACLDNNRNGVGADGSTYTLGPDGKPLD